MIRKSRLDSFERRLVLACFSASMVTFAASADAAQPTERASRISPVEEVVVTARRREESLQDVPAAVSVYSNEEMFFRGTDSMDRLRDVVPNFQFASDLAYRSRVSVRGLGSDRSGAQTNGVGFFIDGVYQNGTARFNAPFFDVERVEVLKGPQGARYGRNAFAGVVNVVTRKPDNELQINAQTVVENKGGLEYAGSVSGPLIRDRLYAKASFAHNESDGDYKHAITGRDMVQLESDFHALRLVWDATDRLEFDLNMGKSDNDGITYAFSQTRSLQRLSENFLVRDDQASGADYEDYSLTATWTGDRIEILNRFAYYDYLNHLRADGDVTPYDGILSIVKLDGDQWSNEIRVQSVGGGRLHWMFGGEIVGGDFKADFPTFFLEEVDLALLGFEDPATRDFLMSISPSENTIDGDSDIWSVFAEVSYEFADRLELTLSARYDDIRKTVFNDSAGPAGSGGLGAKFKDSAIQPLISARYTIDNDTSVYASAARGIREGGFNASALTRDYAKFDTDDVWSYEIGLKKALPQWRGHINAAVFFMDADTLNQAAIIITDAGSLANGAITMGGAESWGIEIDTSLALTDNLTWSAAVGYLDCELKDVPPFDQRSPDEQQVSGGVMNGNECQDSSDWTFNTALTGEWTLGQSNWMAVGSVSVSGKGKTRLASDPLLRRSEEMQDPYYLVDVTAGIRSNNWSILAYVENLTNELYATDHFSAQGLIDSGLGGAVDFITTLAPKRRYGLKLRYDL